MKVKSINIFKIILFFIIAAGFFLRLFVVSGNNIFFTVDQGRDAVYIREILQSRKIFLKGPETNIRGIFAGPLIYYFFALGYFLVGGHPVGGVLALSILNLGVCVFLAFWLKKKIGSSRTLLLIAALQVFWPFFETSLWSFNPFPLAAISILLIVLLTEFLKGQKKYYYLSLALVFMAFNAEIAGAAAFFIFWILIGFWGVKKDIVSFKKYLVLAVVLPIFGGVFLARQFVLQLFSGDARGSTEAGRNAGRVFFSTDYVHVAKEYINLIVSTFSPGHIALGVVFFLIAVLFFKKHKNKLNRSVHYFIVLSVVLIATSYIFFGATQGWRSWHTIFVAPIVFLSFGLLFLSTRSFSGRALFCLLVIFNIIFFTNKFFEYKLPGKNPSTLYNQIAAVDFIYKDANDQGFKVYNYTDRFLDYPYQYLFWWYGLNTYGYLPEEYSNYPLSPKETYVPGNTKYIEPKRSGEYLKYLLIESDTNGEDNSDWIDTFRNYHDLLETKNIGDIKIEKYRRKNDAPNDPCIWWGSCNK